MNYTEFKKKVKGIGVYEVYEACPYFNHENWSAKSIIVSDQVNEVTELRYNRKCIGFIFPYKGSIQETFEGELKTLQKVVGVMSPCVTIFKDKKKVLAVSEEKQCATC